MTDARDYFPKFYFDVIFFGDKNIIKHQDFIILTAYATTDQIWSIQQNIDADERLLKTLRERGVEPVRVTGASEDGAHAEPGWGFVMALPEAIELGQIFLQDALYQVIQDELYVVSCRWPERRARAGSFSARWRG